MGRNQQFFLKKGMIMAACLCSVIGIILNSVAMGTNNWILSEGSRGNTTGITYITVNYGLFNGQKILEGQIAKATYSLAVFCPSGEGVCLVSCGKNETEQKSEFDYLRFGYQKFVCKPKTDKSTATALQQKTETFLISNENYADETSELDSVISDRIARDDDQFMEYDLWITTIIFLSIMLACQVIAAGLCALNTATVPIEAWVGPMGIYIANIIGGLVGIITLSLWGGLYSTNLSKELAIQETILDEFTMNSTGLGFSYWFVFASLLLTICSCVCIRFRNVLRKHSNKGTDNSNSAPGVLIF